MKHLFVIAIFLTGKIYAQTVEDAWIYFNNKPQAQYYLDNPLQMLSQRALDRRETQNIPLDITDVPIEEAYLNQITNTPQIQVMAQSKWLNAVHVRGDLQQIASLLSHSFVSQIEYANKSLNGKIVRPQRSYPNQKNDQLLQEYNYGLSANQIEMLNGHLLHQQGYTGSGKIIAVLDNGFVGVDNTVPFQRLHNQQLLLGGYNFVQRSDNFYHGGSHGTAVLSTMAGYDENNLIGTAPNAQYYLFVTEDSNSENPVEESYWVEAAERADSLGVDIINTSLGYNNFDNTSYSYQYEDMDGLTTFISRGVNMASSKGILCVCSAGNEGNKSWQYITAPADAVGAFTIGAVDSMGDYVTFSSIGPTADNRIKPDVVAQGASAISSGPNGTITPVNGTSFSSPIIAGLMACLWEAHPQKTNLELMQAVRETASIFHNPNNLIGYGIPDFSQALQNLSLAEIKENNIQIYPNPVDNLLYIEGATIQEVKLIDMLGKIVFEQQLTTQHSIDITHLKPGFYLYQIQTDTDIIKGKIIKR